MFKITLTLKSIIIILLFALQDNTDTQVNHHYIVPCIGMNDLANVIRADFTHKYILICASTIYMRPYCTITATYHFFFVTFLTHKTVPTVSVNAGFYVDLNPVVSMRVFALRFSFCLCACGFWFVVFLTFFAAAFLSDFLRGLEVRISALLFLLLFFFGGIVGNERPSKENMGSD